MMSSTSLIFSRRLLAGTTRIAALAAGAALLLAAGSVQAQVVTFTGTDSGAGPGAPTPFSNAAATQFDTAASLLGTQALVTFENAPVGAFSSLTLAPGATLTGADIGGSPQMINNTPDIAFAPALAGFNTTPGGANYVSMNGGTLTFSFANGVQDFGAYFTGVQPVFFTDTITFNDGTDQSVIIPAADSSSGGVTFAGFTDAGKSISTVTITASDANSGDFIGVDDVRFGPAAVPEASTTVSFGLLLALGGVVVAVRKKKAAATA